MACSYIYFSAFSSLTENPSLLTQNEEETPPITKEWKKYEFAQVDLSLSQWRVISFYLSPAFLANFNFSYSIQAVLS